MMNKGKMERKYRRDKEPSCPNCATQYQYFTKDPPNVIGPRCPLLLNCGHTMCAECLRFLAKKSTHIQCKVCSTVSEADFKTEILELFPINIFTIGQIFTRKSGKPKDDMIGFYTSKKITPLQDSVLCVECNETPSDCLCRQCNARLCNGCFDKLHSTGVTLRKHEKVHIDMTVKIIACEEAFCKEHPEKICEYFCENCIKYICDTCLRKDHLKHSCVDVCEKNKEVMVEYAEAYDEANEVLKQLYATQKKLKNSELQVLPKEVSDTEKQVIQHFSQLHGILQLLEEGFLKQIRDAKIQARNASTDIMSKIENDIKEMETVLAEGKSYLNELGHNNFPLHGMLEKLKNISATPCLMVENNDQGSDKFEFSADPAIIKHLKDHSTLIVPSTRTYELCAKFDLPVQVPIDNPPTAPKSQDLIADKIESLEKALNKTSINITHPSLSQTEVKTKKTSYQEVLRKNRLSLQNKNFDVISVTSSDSDIESISSIAPLTAGTTELVTLCHLVSPSNFYVQRKCAQSILEKLMEHFSKQANIKRQPPENVELGQMYLACFDRDKKWYRGIVKKINTNKTYEVFYVDYGNTEFVQISKLRDIPQRYINFPGQAIHCCLHSCFAVDNVWSEDAVKLMAAMTDGVEFSMYIEEITNITPYLASTHEVHLRSVDDTILSVSDVLIFLGYAHLSEDADTEDIMFKNLFMNPNKNIKTYFKDVSIKQGETFDAHVTHINSPSDFYVQKLSDGGQQLINLMKDLKQVYSSLGPDDYLVLSPISGLPVAAKFKDGEWYRGIILQVVKVCHVLVQYVDFGNIECVKWKDIRTLQPKFLRMNMQGIKCALSDIKPKHPKGWSVPAKKAFENMAEKNTLFRVFIDSVENHHINIILYEIQTDKDICFNGLMVKKGHATSAGPSSIKAVIMHGRDNSSGKDSPSSTNTSVSKSNSQSCKSQQTLKPSLECERTYAMGLVTAEESQDIDSDTLSNAETLAVGGPNEEASRFKVKVLKVVNPGELYVTFEETHKKIKKQTVSMTNFYESTDEEDRKWVVGDKCAVLRPHDNMWYRGLIRSIASNRYKVFIKDIVDIVEVDSSGLRSLDPMFTSMDGSIKCHLSGILPSSGSKPWTLLVIEHLKALLTHTSAEYFINKMGDIVNDSMPVQFWRKTLKIGGALDPVEEDWTDLSQELINQGYVLPDVKSKHYAIMKKNRSNFDNDPPRSNLITWLQESYEDSAQSPFVSDLEKTIASEKAADRIPRSIGESAFNNITDWKPAEPLKSLDLVVYPSYVDFECAVYIHTEENLKTVTVLEDGLSAIFNGTKPKPHDLIWSNGEICIGFYKPQSQWCRGKVKKVTPEHIEVHFVDFGSTEYVQPEDLRKQIAMGLIPIQCHRCITEGLLPVSPDGKWPLRALDFIHGTIVTKKCHIFLKPPTSKTGLYTVLSLIIPSGQNLIDVLLSMHFATYVIDCDNFQSENNDEEKEPILGPEPSDLLVDSKYVSEPVVNSRTEIPDNLSDVSDTTPIVPETLSLPVIDWLDIAFPEEESQNPMAYKKLVLPDSVVELPVEVTTVSSNSTSLNVTMVDCDDPEVRALIDEFDIVQAQIQEEAENMPDIIVPTNGLPCVGCYTEDNVWYRAIVKDIYDNEKMVLVCYVDYGNVEKLPYQRLKAMKKDWLKIPIMCLHVELNDVCYGPNYDKPSLENLMQGCLKTPPYTMSIVSRQPSFQVDLFNSDGQLAYQSLLQMGLLSTVSNI